MQLHDLSIGEIYIVDKIPFSLPCGKADDTPCPSLSWTRSPDEVNRDSFVLSALDLGHPKLSLN